MRWRLFSLVLCIQAAGVLASGQDGISVHVSDLDFYENPLAAEEAAATAEDDRYREASFQPAEPLLVPRSRPAATPVPAVASELSASLFGAGATAPLLLSGPRRTLATGVGTDVALGLEAKARSTTDTGNLLRKSPSFLGMGTQHRAPDVTDSRIRGSRIGRLPASGSFWVPARLDLDTALSKIDSRILDNVITVKGPYAVRYGPNFSHVDFDLLDSPRYEDGFQSHGSTSADFKTNGQQWYGRQMLWGGNADWGFRVGYGHRTGNDYMTGDGIGVPSSYNSRDLDLAGGLDPSPDSSLEFHVLRLDQTGVELPGQAFDIDWLGTTGYEVEYALEDQAYFDRLSFDAWYNRTLLDGSAQRPGKRRQFPIYDFMNFTGLTDVDSLSTGFRLATTWGSQDCSQLTTGVDLRYLRQELNEITSGQLPFQVWQDANSPIPKSDLVNPGMFVESTTWLAERLKLTAGARLDWAGAALLENPANLASLGTSSTPDDPISFADIVGTDQLDHDYLLGALYLTGQYELNSCWTAEAACGYAERPPSLTELYAAETFMFVLNNGLNTVTGDPRLDRERLCQIDLGLRYDNGGLRGRIGGYHAWAWDYITFENLKVVVADAAVQQVQLKYVNTDLATFAGAELAVEYDVSAYLTPFATLSYTDGRDRTRNGAFATKPAAPGSPSTRNDSLSRGAYSGVAGAAQEPLPGISPLESRLGIRLHPATDMALWGVELAARVLDQQDRVATSLLETPTPGFTVWDLRGYWRPRERLLLIAGVENFTDKAYREHLDFRSPSGVRVLQPGINFYTGCELTY